MEYPDSSNGSSTVWTVDGIFEVAYSDTGNREPVIDNINWKFVASVAIIAMAVSLLSGGLAGIPLGVLIIRALVGGVIFLIFALGLNLLINRFIPEIWESPGNEPDAVTTGEMDSGTGSPGSRVDIVLPAENPDSTTGEQSEVVSNGESVDDVEELEEVESVETAHLDDLEHFSGSFSEDDDDIEGTGTSSTKGGPGGDHDPEELAQAIHTVITRDEKG